MVANNVGFGTGLVWQDSRMATPAELTADMNSFHMTSRDKVPAGPVLFRDGDTLYVDSSEARSLVIGDTGSGKTLRFILPLIYSCGCAGESMCVIDPKGDLYSRMSSFLREQKYDLVCIDLRNPAQSPDSWNILKPAADQYDAGRQDECLAVLSDITQVLFADRSQGRADPYWNESAGDFFKGICKIILIKSGGKALNMENVLALRSDERLLSHIYERMDPEHPAYQDLEGVLGLSADRTKTCIFRTFNQMLRQFRSSPDLTRLCSDQTFDMDKIARRKTAVFLIVPDEKQTLHFLATLFLTQTYQALVEEAGCRGGALSVRFNFICEEFCNCPPLPDFMSMMTASRSRGIRFHLVLQSYSQLEEKYGEKVAATVFDQCGNMIYLHSREIGFLKILSEMVGCDEYGHPLLSPSRLQRLPKNETLILHDRCYPIVVRDLPMIFDYPVKLGMAKPRRRRRKVSQTNPEESDDTAFAEDEAALSRLIDLLFCDQDSDV